MRCGFSFWRLASSNGARLRSNRRTRFGWNDDPLFGNHHHHRREWLRLAHRYRRDSGVYISESNRIRKVDTNGICRLVGNYLRLAMNEEVASSSERITRDFRSPDLAASH